MPCAELLIYQRIGNDAGLDEGIQSGQFNEMLKAIPPDREILCRINSPGGNVWDGIAIHNMIAAIKNRVTCQIDGCALSAASFITCAGKRCIAPRSAIMMVHEASMVAVGDADELRTKADMLETHSAQIANIYATKTGRPASEWRAKMKAETWLSAEQAAELGLIDELTDEQAITACASNDFRQWFYKAPENITKLLGQFRDPATDVIVPAPVSNELVQHLQEVTAEFVDHRLQDLLRDLRISEPEIPKARARAIRDTSYLDELAMREPLQGIDALREIVRRG